MDNEDILTVFESYLYQLYDVSKYIQEIICYKGLLMQDFDFYSMVLTCACVEEKYLMSSIEGLLNTLYDINNTWFNRITHNTFKVEYDKYNTYYRIRLPLMIGKNNLGFIKLTNVLREFKEDTNDYTLNIGIDGMDKSDKLFLIACKHIDFCTDEYLRDNNVFLKFI